MKNRTLVVAVAAASLFASGFVAAQINASKYPHMAADHNHGPAVDAHVNKAKELLRDANKELDEAAAVADGHK